MRVSPVKLKILPAGPTSITNATTAFIVTFATLIYNVGDGDAYGLVVNNLVGWGSTPSSLSPLSVFNYQANWANTGNAAPGVFSLVGNKLTFALATGVALNGTNNTESAYTSGAALLITYDAKFNAKGPNCIIRDMANVTTYMAMPSGVNQGKCALLLSVWGSWWSEVVVDCTDITYP